MLQLFNLRRCLILCRLQIHHFRVLTQSPFCVEFSCSICSLPQCKNTAGRWTGECSRKLDRSTDRHQPGCLSSTLHFQSIHPFFNTHLFLSWSAYPSMHWVEEREIPWTGQQSITGLTRTFAFTLTSTPRSNSQFAVLLRKR